jgi:hypothetical protein
MKTVVTITTVAAAISIATSPNFFHHGSDIGRTSWSTHSLAGTSVAENKKAPGGRSSQGFRHTSAVGYLLSIMTQAR